MKLLVGMVLGGLAVWLYGSDRARREIEQRLGRAPESLQQLQHTAATAAASGAQKLAEKIDAAPVPEPVKDAASEAAFNVWAAAEELGQSTPGARVD